MSEADKKGSPWPWILVPVAAVTLFFVLRQCRQNLPPHEVATATDTAAPAADVPPADATPPAGGASAPDGAEPPAQ
jgi:hypothetical protein